MKNEATACRDEAPLVISALAAPTKRRRRQRTTKLVASKRTFVFRLERLCIQLLCFGDSKGSAHQQMSMSQATPSARPLATRQSTSSGRGDAKGFRSARDWTAEEVAVWIRGVEKVDRDVLEGFIEEGIDGTKLCELGKEDLGDFGVCLHNAERVAHVARLVYVSILVLSPTSMYRCRECVVILASRHLFVPHPPMQAYPHSYHNSPCDLDDL
eukprot:m.265251 g.265251  ORF g.265251 m.265251 type:complete len:213 (-) comp15627_c0_seq2:114-752(-)